MSVCQNVLGESVNGRMSLRVMGAAGVFQARMRGSLDAWNRQSFTSLSMVNMSMLASYLLSFFITTATALFIILGDAKEDPARAGLAVTYSLLM